MGPQFLYCERVVRNIGFAVAAQVLDSDGLVRQQLTDFAGRAETYFRLMAFEG